MSGTGRSFICAACVMLILVCAPGIDAQDAQPFRLFAGGGIELPSGSLNDAASHGYVGTVGIAVRPALHTSPEINLIFRATYSRFPSSSDESGDVTFRAGSIELQLDRALNDVPNIFVVGGGGVTRTEVDPRTFISFATGVTGVEVTKPGYIENNPFMTAGVGMQAGFLILEARLTNAFGTHTKNLTWFSLMLEFSTK